MPKLDVYCRNWGKRYIFYCPGCRENHSVDVRTDGQHPTWTFNNDLLFPTFSPSVNYINRKCHFFIENGKIKYLSDCSHLLANQVIDMINIQDHDSNL